MKALEKLYHHGIIVDDIHAAMADTGKGLGVDWAPVRQFDPIRVWIPETGWSEANLEVTYSRQGPIHVELIQARAGGAYDALRAVSKAHVGAWSDDVGADVEVLLAEGWRLIAAGASPKHRYGQMAYLAREGRPVLELVGEPVRPMIEAWINA